MKRKYFSQENFRHVHTKFDFVHRLVKKNFEDRHPRSIKNVRLGQNFKKIFFLEIFSFEKCEKKIFSPWEKKVSTRAKNLNKKNKKMLRFLTT